jgi:phosphoribosylglycinamide formyltransferase 1
VLCDPFTIDVSPLHNLIVELDRTFEIPAINGIEVEVTDCVDERTLAWIDDAFGGSWSSEAVAGSNVIARHNGAPIAFATIDSRGPRFAWLQGIAREPGVGLFGPFGVSPEQRHRGIGALVLRRALDELRVRYYARALIAAVGDDSLIRYYADAVGARVCESFERETLYRANRRALVMASGSGSNFQAVVAAVNAGGLPIDVVALFSNNLHALALVRARDAGIPSHALPWSRREESRKEYDARLLEAAAAEEPDLVLLLGWMHLLEDEFVRAFPEMLNIHPAFLPLDPRRNEVGMPDGTQIPAFRGPRAVRDAIGVASPWVGATLHRVTSETDRGPVFARKPLRVKEGEDEEHLMERVHEIERGVVRAGIMRWSYER